MQIPHSLLKTLGLCGWLGYVGLAAYTAQAQPPDNLTADDLAARQAPVMSITALQQALGGPTTLTLHEKDATPQATLDDLIKQAEQQGVNLQTWPPHLQLQLKQPVTVDLEAQPFWPVLRVVAPKLGLFLERYAQQEGISLATWRNGASGGLEQNSWPCLMVAHTLERVQVFTQVLGSPQPARKTDTLRLSIAAFLDPKVHFQAQHSSLRLDEVVDERGHSLIENKSIQLNAYSNNNVYGNNGARPFFDLSVPIKQPSGLGKRITRFKATLRLVVTAKQETWATPDILTAAEVSKTVDDKTYTVLPLEKRGEAYVAHLWVSSVVQAPDGPGGFEVFSNARLVDAAGHEYMRRSVDNNISAKGLTANITFVRPDQPINDKNQPATGEPVKLIWSFPTQMRTVEVPVEFDNLPLP